MKVYRINVFKNVKAMAKVVLMIAIASLCVSQVSYAISDKGIQRKCGVGNANIKCWQNYANKNNSYAQFVLGIFYGKGVVIDKDMKKSLMWYNRSANNGYYKAKYNLATMYYDGFEVKQDYHKSLHLYEDVAEIHHTPRAELMIARIYKNGLGVVKDKITAYAWYMLANIKESDVKVEESHLATTLNADERKKAMVILQHIKSKRKF